MTVRHPEKINNIEPIDATVMNAKDKQPLTFIKKPSMTMDFEKIKNPNFGQLFCLN